nr:hypothetical protein [Pseudomonadota bacterium]
FGADGVIFGTTTADLGTGSANVSATLSGLIGVDGAVAVFAGNDASTDGSYAGGFVARPTFTANYNGWLDSFGNKTLRSMADHTVGSSSDFLQGGPTQIDSGNVTNTNSAPVSILMLTMADNPNNGVSFFNGLSGVNGSKTSIHRFYAGILSGTNVGELLAPYVSGGDETATWKGKIQWVGFLGGIGFPGSNAGARDIDLNVNYKNRTIDAFVNMDGSINHHLLLNAGYNSRGQFTNGTVKYGVFESAGLADRNATPGFITSTPVQYDQPFNGTLTGIIGQEGAVGAFVNDSISAPSGSYGFAGGFWVVPPQ